MSTSTTINFAARQNKAIERSLIFDALRGLQVGGVLDKPVYIGLGSVWFADFHMAQRLLDVHSMISIESDEIKYSRARFNRPFQNIDVIYGTSQAVLPRLLEDEGLTSHPWVVWLDYDRSLFDDELADLLVLTDRIPAGSVLLTTFNSDQRNFTQGGAKDSRLAFLRDLFGEALTEDLEVSDVNQQTQFAETLAKLVQNSIHSKALSSGRDGGYIPAFKVKYSDGAAMLTIGGIFPNEGDSEKVAALVGSTAWVGDQESAISLPSLTAKEVMAIRSLLPSSESVTRQLVSSSLGFELQESAIEGFVRYYLRFPVYLDIAQIL
jgi:hypothetical protein